MNSVLTDLRHSARSLARSPGLAVALLFTIALGIGGNVTVYGFIRGLTPRAKGVVSLFGAGAVSYGDYLAVKSRLDWFEWIGAARISQRVVTLTGRPVVMTVAAVTPELVRLFELSPDQGVVISRRVWQGEFGGKADVRGERVRIGNVEGRVAGVAPARLAGVYADRAIDLWTASLDGRDRKTPNVWVLAKVRAGLSVPGDLRAVPYTGMTPETAAGLARVGTLLRIAAGFVFFIACANVAAFLLGRAAARLQETSLRVALGAGRGRLARAVLSDSFVISAGGGALGVLVAVWTSKAVPALLFEQDAEFLVPAPDVLSIVAAAAAGVGIMIACGLLPLFETPYDRPAAVLHRESADPSRANRFVRAGLVIGQMACCCLLVISTGFLYEGFRGALETGVSRSLGRPVLATVQAQPDAGIRYFRDVQRAARSVAGVAGMSWAGRLPGSQPAWQTFRVEPQRLPLREVELDVAGLTADSLALFTLPPRAGRLFGFADRACRVAIVNAEAAGALFGDDTVGRSVEDAAGRPVEIIGVVAARGRSRPTLYYDHTDQAGPSSERIGRARFRAPVASNLGRMELDANVVSPGYFGAMGLTLAAGRIFPDDPQAGGCRAGMVNQEAADLYFGGNAVEAAVIDEVGRRTEIVGVVRSARLGTFQRRAEPAIYFPMEQDYLLRMTLILGARNASGAMLVEMRRTLEAVPGRGPAPVEVKTLETHLGETALAPLRIATVMLGASAVTALLLSVLGLYGSLNDAARQRRRELAVRVALGARRRDVIGQVLWEGGRLAGAGALVGVVGALLLSRVAGGIVPSGGSPKLWVWIAGPIVSAAAVALASVLPARRALMTDPLRILRQDY